MKFLKLFVAIVLISGIVGIGKAFNGSSGDSETIDEFIEKYSVDDEEIETSVATDKQENEIENNAVEETHHAESLNESKETEVITQTETKQVETNNNSKQEEVVEQKNYQQETVEQKEITAWEELGITENEYYNSPMWSWATIDFSVSDYGTESACRNACIQAGENSDMGFSCSTINSYSGRYLGEMLQLF